MMAINDPTYNRADIDANPQWRLAFVLSEIDNDNAPIGWFRYVSVARYVLEHFTPKGEGAAIVDGTPPQLEKARQAIELLRDMILATAHGQTHRDEMHAAIMDIAPFLSGGVERAGTCATCRFSGEFTYAPPGVDPRNERAHDRRQCRALRDAMGEKPTWVPLKNPDGSLFGCTLHALPPPPDAERARRE